MSKYRFSDEPEVRAFKNGANADPQEIGEALKEIADANNGLLKPSYVVKAAADKDSRLHQYFEWDDVKAAHSYRVSQARAIIRSVIITRDDEDTPPIRAFVSIANNVGVAYRYSVDARRLTFAQMASDGQEITFRIRESQDRPGGPRDARKALQRSRARLYRDAARRAPTDSANFPPSQRAALHKRRSRA
jgi:hypothetical protein